MEDKLESGSNLIANIRHEVYGGKVTFKNTSSHKFSEKDISIVTSLVRSNLSSLMMEDTDIRIDLTNASSLGVKTQGEAFTLGTNEHGVVQCGIFLKAKMLRDVLDDSGKADRRAIIELAELIAHELVHCKQYRENWLTVDKYGYSLWKGELQDAKGRYFDDIQYRKRPWEVMAFAAQKSLAKSAIQDLIGQSIISAEEGEYIPKTDAEKAAAALRAIRVAEREKKNGSAGLGFGADIK